MEMPLFPRYCQTPSGTAGEANDGSGKSLELLLGRQPSDSGRYFHVAVLDLPASAAGAAVPADAPGGPTIHCERFFPSNRISASEGGSRARGQGHPRPASGDRGRVLPGPSWDQCWSVSPRPLFGGSGIGGVRSWRCSTVCCGTCGCGGGDGACSATSVSEHRQGRRGGGDDSEPPHITLLYRPASSGADYHWSRDRLRMCRSHSHITAPRDT